MNEVLFLRRSQGATNCVAIGAFDGETAAELRSHRDILWLNAHDGELCAPRLTSPRPDPLPHDIASAVRQFIRRDARRLPSLAVSQRVLQRDADCYADLIGLVHQILDQHHRARQTREKDGFRWQQHLLANTGAYVARRMPEAWRNALGGQPAFICGAGPSLDVSIEHVATHAGRAVVFAADSALRALAARGVEADFAVSIDAAKVPEKCLPATHSPARVILSAVSPPNWTEAVPSHATFFLSSNQITLDWLAKHDVARTALPAAENCGSTALDLARFLGCAPIYLFGLDLALDAANPAIRHHDTVEASLYRESGFAAAQAHPTIPGNYAERVPTFAPTDWRALDERLAGWPAGLVINVNDRGARFRNTTLVHPRDFAWSTTPATAASKVASLAQLVDVAPASLSASASSAASRLNAIGRQALSEAPSLRASLASQGPDGAVLRLRRFFGSPDVAQIFGAFSLKLMPHLLPPVEGDTATWSQRIDEFAQLAQLAASCRF